MNSRKLIILLVFVFALGNDAFSQDEFKFKDSKKRAVTLYFQSINNLIILSAKLNGKPINFLVDTGVNKTKVFGQIKDSVSLKNTEYLSLRSLGSSKPVKAYKTLNNYIDFGPIAGGNQEVYYITDDRFDLASKLGVNVQGIIGYEFLKQFIFRLNYVGNSLRVYQHQYFHRKLRGFNQIDLRLIRKKPHVKVAVKLLNTIIKDLIFLVDTGSSDAFWVFEEDGMFAPSNAFQDYVGYGLETAILGKRAKMESAQLGKYKLDEPKIAYIDSTSVKLFTANRYKNGIIGAQILKKFILFLDYKNQKLYLRPSSFFNDISNYDRSGLFLTYVGEKIKTIKTPVSVTVNQGNSYQVREEDSYFQIRVEISRILEVTNIRKNSPAAEVDIKVGDRILSLNGKSVNRMEPEEITNLLSSEEGKRIKVMLQRDDELLRRVFYLRSQLNEKGININ